MKKVLLVLVLALLTYVLLTLVEFLQGGGMIRGLDNLWESGR